MIYPMCFLFILFIIIIILVKSNTATWKRFTVNYWILLFCYGFPDSSAGKESACNAGDLGSIPGLGRSPGGRHGNLLKYSCLENPQEQRSLVGYSPWGHKESDTTERLNTAYYSSLIFCWSILYMASWILKRIIVSFIHDW